MLISSFGTISIMNIFTPSTSYAASNIIWNAPLISQNPELKNGCEATSVAMLLQY